jgi:hypothetical protein
MVKKYGISIGSKRIDPMLPIDKKGTRKIPYITGTPSHNRTIP